ncbi:MAG: metal ABC transporter permease [Betaproteobacteria bacterium]|jgi:zinc/manganese transport system permease protein
MGTGLAWADAWFLAPAAALLFSVWTLAPLGAQVLARGVVFIDLAVAQAAAAAALWAGALMDHPDWIATQLLAAFGALACSALVAFLSHRWPAQREALIGLLYVLGASAALLGARQDAHGRERMTELLAADVLWAQWPQVGLLGACAVVVSLLGARLQRDRVFFPVFAVVASLAVPVLGLFLVFATLIAPALWQRAGVSLRWACLGAVAASGLGLAASWMLDAPSGACIALALSGYGALSAVRAAGGRRAEPPAGPGQR